MEFLRSAQAEPCAGESECRTWDWFQTKDLLIKAATGFHIVDVEGDMVEFVDSHWNGCKHFCCSCKRTGLDPAACHPAAADDRSVCDCRGGTTWNASVAVDVSGAGVWAMDGQAVRGGRSHDCFGFWNFG